MELLKNIRIELISQRKIFEVRAVPGRIAAAFLHIMAEIRISPAPAAKPFIDSRVLLQKVVRPLLNLGDPFGEDLRLHLKLDKHVNKVPNTGNSRTGISHAILKLAFCFSFRIWIVRIALINAKEPYPQA